MVQKLILISRMRPILSHLGASHILITGPETYDEAFRAFRQRRRGRGTYHPYRFHRRTSRAIPELFHRRVCSTKLRLAVLAERETRLALLSISSRGSSFQFACVISPVTRVHLRHSRPSDLRRIATADKQRRRKKRERERE